MLEKKPSAVREGKIEMRDMLSLALSQVRQGHRLKVEKQIRGRKVRGLGLWDELMDNPVAGILAMQSRLFFD